MGVTGRKRTGARRSIPGGGFAAGAEAGNAVEASRLIWGRLILLSRGRVSIGASAGCAFPGRGRIVVGEDVEFEAVCCADRLEALVGTVAAGLSVFPDDSRRQKAG